MAIGDVKTTGPNPGAMPDTPVPVGRQPAAGAARTATGEIRDGELLPGSPNAIRNEDTSSLVLPKPGDRLPADSTDSESKELGFVRSALDWLRKNLAKNPWVRAAVAVAGLLMPQLAFLSVLLLALDGILLLDKLVAGEKIRLDDVLSFAASAGAAAVDPQALLPASQLAIAGYTVFERWMEKRTRQNEAVAAIAARDKDELVRHVAELRQRTESALAGQPDSAEGSAAERQLVDDLSTALAALRQKEGQLDTEDLTGRNSLRSMTNAVAEDLARVDAARPGWLERLWQNAKELAGPELEPSAG